MHAVLLRSIERMMAVLGGITAIICGYLLFTKGIDKGVVNFSWGTFVVTGQGPGILLAMGGIAVLVVALKSSLVSKTSAARNEQARGSATQEQLLSLGKLEDGPDDRR